MVFRGFRASENALQLALHLYAELFSSRIFVIVASRESERSRFIHSFGETCQSSSDSFVLNAVNLMSTDVFVSFSQLYHSISLVTHVIWRGYDLLAMHLSQRNRDANLL